MRDAKPDRRNLLLTLAKLHPIWAPPRQAVRAFTRGGGGANCNPNRQSTGGCPVLRAAKRGGRIAMPNPQSAIRNPQSAIVNRTRVPRPSRSEGWGTDRDAQSAIRNRQSAIVNPQSSVVSRQSNGGRYERQTAPTRLVYNCFDDNGLRAGAPARTHPRSAGVCSSK